MQKEAIKKLTKAIPDLLKEVTKYLKSNIQHTGPKAILNASGTVGLVIKLFGHTLVEQYFSSLAKRKLDEHGSPTYLVAAFEQAEESLQHLSQKYHENIKMETALEALESILENIEQEMDIDKSEVIIVFQPKYHPAVLYVKNTYLKLFDEVGVSEQAKNEFIKHFNEHIGTQVVKTFGSSYNDHMEQISELRLSELETDFLWKMKNLEKIGFNSTENLKYELSYAKWKPVEDFMEIDDLDLGEKKTETEEESLEPVERLIEDYFNYQPQDNLNKILFILGDFGKGKSVFLKQYASNLAKEYLQTGEGLFPVYFNLRNYKNYSSEYKLGIIADYLETDYGIQIDDLHFRHKNYIFLIDSLDESGDLSKSAIDNVINSIKSIQNLDKTKYRTNRIVITSRPFDSGMRSQLKNHHPHIIKNGFGRDVEYFISLYGFTKRQFNNWMIDTLINYPDFKELETTGLTKKVQQSIQDLKFIDIYEELLNNGTLSRSELRRPIFAYMIFKLLVNNIDFSMVGKIGVYLSFINLLTREAKYIGDRYELDLKREFEFRNILHSISALSMHEWHKGNQWKLNKADICRVLDGENTNETDDEVLERYKEQGVLEIEFLSHSYFGENDNILHFQHQSFAEILLAEYYLKVFIKFALDEDFDVEKARVKLMLGEPTGQTIQFLVEMLRLLRSSAAEGNSDKVIQKRKLLFPFMASLATKKYNNLFCHDVYYEWFKKFDIPANTPDYPAESLENWFFTQEKIDQVVKFAHEVLESKSNHLLLKGKSNTALFDKEVFSIQKTKLNRIPPDTDKWLALLVGNILYNKEREKQYFNSTLNSFENLFDMIRNWNFYSINDSSPYWAKSLFKGINMKNNPDEFNMSYANLTGLDFSNSTLKLLNLSASRLGGCRFDNVSFSDVDFSFSDLTNTQISNIRSLEGIFDTGFTLLSPEIFFPPQLARKFYDSGFMGNQRSFIPESGFSTITQIFGTLKGLLKYGIQNNLFSKDEIVTWFKFETSHLEDLFKRKLNELSRIDGEVYAN
jgi:hypothetical protein